MAIAALQNVEHEFDAAPVLRGLNLEISAGERVALVGPNGSGKTTIFRILAGQLEPTSGKVFRAKSVAMGYLPQEAKVTGDQTVRQVARHGLAELPKMERRMRQLSEEMAEATGDRLGRLMAEYGRLEARHTAAGGFAWEHRIEQVLTGVGFGHQERDRPCRLLSGGQQRRLALAEVLLGRADLLLLDEPTNHLDLRGVQWLEKYLARTQAAVLLVSHDRYLLDRLATKIYELSDGVTQAYPGNYTGFVQQRRIRDLQRQRQVEADRAYVAKEQDFIARFHASTSRSREARGRATRLQRQLKAGELVTHVPRQDKKLALKIAAGSRGSDLAVRMRGVCKAFDGAAIVQDLSLDLRGGHKLAILGPNGVGKTTLLRMVMGQEAPDAGSIKVGQGMTVGYYDQKQVGLDGSLTVLQQMKLLAGSPDEAGLRSFLAQFLFTGDDVFKPVATLSGGQRSRLLLARLLHHRPNFLILDEPTNHLDLPSREILQQALGQYDGTVMLVTHDRYLVDHVCGRVLMLYEDRWELVEGNYSAWRTLNEERAQSAGQAALSPPGRARAGQGTSQNADSAVVAKVGGLNTYQFNKLSLAEVEQQIHQAERELTRVEASFSTPEVFSDGQKLEAAQQHYDQLRGRIDGLMAVWQVKMEQQPDR